MADPVDYAALAKQAGAVSSQPSGGGSIDYAALAKQAGAVSSTSPAQQHSPGPGSRFLSGLYESTIGPAVEAAKHPLEALTGVVAPAVYAAQHPLETLKAAGSNILSHAVVPIPDEVLNGDFAKAAGKALGTGLSFTAPELLENLPKSVRITPSLANPNPVEAEAVQYLQRKGVPVDAGTATGSTYVRGLQKLADTSPIGAAVSRNAEAAAVSGVRRVASELVADQTPAVSAERHYTDFRAAEASPNNMRTVPTGETDPLGDPVMQSMPMPVPVGSLKSTLKPILDEMSWMPAADRNASAGYQAIKKIVEGPDYIPASTAEIGLGGIKKMAREDVGRNRGLAKFITPKLQQLIDGVVSETGGADAVDSLQQARAAAAREAGADWLTDTFKGAEAEGGFNHTQALWGKWTRLADDAKKTMFSPDQARDLNNFFLGVKKLAENPNPSGSGVIANIGGQMALLGTRPAAGAAVILGTGAISKLLHTPGGVQLLTEGIKIPVGSTRGVMVANRIAQLIGKGTEQPQQ